MAAEQILPAQETRAAVWSLMLSGVVWGLIWWPLKYFAGLSLTGHAIALTAYALVSLVAIPFIWREYAQWKTELGLLLLIGLFFGCANLAFTTALMTGSVVRAMLLFYLLPAWGAIGGALFLKERLRPRRLLAVFLSLAGVFTIMGGLAVFAQPLSLADGLALLAGLCYTAASITNRKARLIPLLSRTLVTFLGCSVLAVLMLMYTQPVLPPLSFTDWSLLVLFAFLWLLGGSMLTTYGVTHVQASRAAVLQVVELLVAVLSAIVIGGERLAFNDYLGAALIVTATLIEATSQANA